MKGRKQQSRAEPSLRVHRLLEGEQLVLSDSDTLLLVVRGACTVHGRAREPERIEAGALLSRQSRAASGMDRPVARALSLLQAEPARRWTVAQLSRAAGVSRAAFARRFADVTGRPPLRYLTELRLSLAADLLERTCASLAELALEVGYRSEFAFSRAFRRQYGIAPGRYRQRRRAAALGAPPIRLAA